jgi:hypothetical protein
VGQSKYKKLDSIKFRVQVLPCFTDWAELVLARRHAQPHAQPHAGAAAAAAPAATPSASRARGGGEHAAALETPAEGNKENRAAGRLAAAAAVAGGMSESAAFLKRLLDGGDGGDGDASQASPPPLVPAPPAFSLLPAGAVGAGGFASCLEVRTI